jgi:hypothetical protein
MVSRGSSLTASCEGCRAEQRIESMFMKARGEPGEEGGDTEEGRRYYLLAGEG